MAVVNSTGNARVLTSPAEATGVIAVGACDVCGTSIPAYSGRGELANGMFRPHLVAPGGTSTEGMYSLYSFVNAMGEQKIGIGEIGFGTSFSAPCVTGFVARLLEKYPNLEPDQIRDKLISLCLPIAGANSIAQGAGRLFPTTKIP